MNFTAACLSNKLTQPGVADSSGAMASAIGRNQGGIVWPALGVTKMLVRRSYLCSMLLSA